MSRELNMMINSLNVQLARAQNDAIVQQRAADAERQKFEPAIAQQNARFETLTQQNAAAAAQSQKNFEAQLVASKQANEATVAGLNQLLIENKAASDAQAAQFAESSAAAEARYQDQVARSARLASAYIPAAQQTATAPAVGDARVASQQVSRQNQLSNLSIVNNPQKTNQLSGLQIA